VALQSERKSDRQTALEEVALLAELAEFKGETFTASPLNGFAFSAEEIDGHRRLKQARISLVPI
jgi:hypothetical protein